MHVTATGDLLQRHSIHEMCVEDIDLEALIPHLNNQDLLTASEEEHLVNAQLMKNVRIDALLRFISMRDGGFDKFVTAVGREKSHSGHQSLYTAFNSDWLEVGKIHDTVLMLNVRHECIHSIIIIATPFCKVVLL